MIANLKSLVPAVLLIVLPQTAHSDVIVEYTFADGNATTADNTGTLGSSMDGTITGGSITASPLSPDGMGLLLGGAAGNGISMPNGYDFGGQFTVSVLARLDMLQSTSNILFDDFGNPGVLLQVNSSSQKLSFQFTTLNDGTVALQSSGVFPLNSWQKVTAVYNGSRAHLLINGSVVDSATASGAVQNHPSVTPNIGVESDNVSFPWKGAVDDFSISDTAIAIPEPSTFYYAALIGIGLFCRRSSMQFLKSRKAHHFHCEPKFPTEPTEGAKE